MGQHRRCLVHRRITGVSADAACCEPTDAFDLGGSAGGTGAGVRAPVDVPAVRGAGVRDDPGRSQHGGGDGGGRRDGREVARLAVRYLLADGEPLVVACDGTFFRRWGRKVFQARWAYDGSAQGGKKVAFGNTWVVAALVVKLPFCSSPAALPVLFRLWRGKGTAFHGESLIAEGTTWTTRLPANAVLYGPKPPPTGKRGRPRVKGDRLGTCAQIAVSATWAGAVISVYGHDTTVQITVIDA